MKGRNKSAEEVRFHNALCQIVGCIACRIMGLPNFYVSVHHCDGRTKPHAHKFVLPLCGAHHQATEPSVQSFHGNKARFEKLYGTQRELLAKCIELLDEVDSPVPDESRKISGAGMQLCE